MRRQSHPSWVSPIPFQKIANSYMPDYIDDRMPRPNGLTEDTDEIKVEAAMARLRSSSDEENALE
jgi:hypothetical protein